MGKVFNYISILLFADMLFIITGQACTAGACSLGSITFNAMINLAAFNFSQFFIQLFGDIANLFTSGTGIAALIVGGAVTLGSIVTRSDTLLFIPVALTLGLIVSDFVFLYGILFNINPVIATVIMAPLIVLYGLAVVEWVKGRD